MAFELSWMIVLSSAVLLVSVVTAISKWGEARLLAGSILKYRRSLRYADEGQRRIDKEIIAAMTAKQNMAAVMFGFFSVASIVFLAVFGVFAVVCVNFLA